MSLEWAEVLTLLRFSLPDVSQGCVPPPISLHSENMATSHKWCLKMNNKACKGLHRGWVRTRARAEFGFLDSLWLRHLHNPPPPPAGSFHSWHKLLRGPPALCVLFLNSLLFPSPFVSVCMSTISSDVHCEKFKLITFSNTFTNSTPLFKSLNILYIVDLNVGFSVMYQNRLGRNGI